MAAEDPPAGSDAARRFADLSRTRYRARQARLERERLERESREAERVKAIALDPVAAALARARARQSKP